MIEYTTGDILASDAEALVNTVNCVGVMGRGIALQFRHAFPRNFREYADACARREVVPGRMLVHEIGSLSGPRYIVNFPTKRHWRGKSQIEDVEAGLGALAEEIRRRGISSIAIPPLGSGLGGLEWADVRPRIEAALRGFNDVRVVVFEPTGERRRARAADVPAMTPGRAALVGLVDRYLRVGLDPIVTLLEIHKLMYFLQEAGEPLRLTLRKAPYGPSAENLRHVMRAVEGHFFSGYDDGGDDPYKEIEIVPGAAAEAEKALAAEDATRARFDRVVRLIEGFEAPSALELLATTHWVCAKEGARGLDAAIAAVHAWNERKRQFSPRQIGIAHAALASHGWLPA